MNVLDDVKIGTKLIGSFLVVVIIMIIVGIIGYMGVTTTDSYLDKMYSEQLVPTDILESLDGDLWQLRGNSPGYAFLTSTRSSTKATSDELVRNIDANLTKYEPYIASDKEREIFNKGKKAWEGYKEALSKFYITVDSGKNEDIITELTTGDLVTQRKEFSETLKELVSMNFNEAKSLSDEGKKTVSNIILVTLLGIIIGVVIALSLGYLISRSITVPLSRGVHMMQEMSMGHLDNRLNLNRKDEIGELTTAMDTFSDDLQYVIIDGMKKIAAGDLSVSVQSHDDRDEIAPAFNQLIAAINGIVGEVGMLITEAEEGRLKKRGDASGFTGEYQNIVIGINNMLDAIVTPIKEALRVAGLYSQAKFTTRFNEDIKIKGDLIALKVGMDTIGTELSTAITSISEQVNSLSASSEEAAASVEEITAGSATIAQSSSVVSSNAEKSLHAVEQVLAAMEELNQSVSTVAAKVDSVSRLTQDANGTSSNGVKQAAVAEQGIKAINGAVNDVGIIIGEIRDQMNEINKIVVIISDIADQTNLLALNAAIEAARAGEAGMGFAVVANEVKTLAQESQGSAENIAKIITSLQKQSERAATAMDLATGEVSKGSVAITDTIEFFHTIAEQVEEIAQHMGEVASLSEEEAAAVQEITSSVSEVRSMTGQTVEEAVGSAAATEESSAALNQVSTIIGELSVIATNINESVSRLNG
ncbi:MAG TPA: methyl-accepting chemotaxis protein [Methanospirillum sp.]|uniref:HAMP domain-containing methyl-accepting chemotaxis protein n=1 Tax=Methanospirillum sp. TaxID=45200 RepID=UPI002BDB7EC2|nr:methyl-accepting chemotaxis protein [Methanospirillum sp.]HWQ62952.1 methyl-accepting chemotaxis protein [Methanospirillum sp.]